MCGVGSGVARVWIGVEAGVGSGKGVDDGEVVLPGVLPQEATNAAMVRAARRIVRRRMPCRRVAATPVPVYHPGSETGTRTCGDVWFRQGLATGEREPRMLLRPR